MADWYSIQPQLDFLRKMHISLSLSYLFSKLCEFRAHYQFLLWIFKELPILFVVFFPVRGYGSWELRYSLYHIFILMILFDRYTLVGPSLWFLFYRISIILTTWDGLSRRLMFSSYILNNYITTCKNIPNLTTMERIQARTRFIQEDNPRIAHQCNSNR